MGSAQHLAPQGFFDLLTDAVRCSDRLRQLLSQEAQRQQLTELDGRVLWICHREQAAGINQAELARELDLSPAHISTLVEDLRKRGVLLGERRPPDRRRQFWTLTAKGESILSRLAEALDAAIRGSTAIESASARFSTVASQLDAALENVALASESAAVSIAQKSSQQIVADRAA